MEIDKLKNSMQGLIEGNQQLNDDKIRIVGVNKILE